MANLFLEENKSIKSKLTSKWEEERVESNIANLKEIIIGINKELSDEAIKKYVTESLVDFMASKKEKKYTFGGHLLKNFTESMLPFDIAKYSLCYSIDNDFYWVKDGTVKDHYEVALGLRDPETFGIYCGEKITFIQKYILPYLASSSDYNGELLASVVSNFDHQKAANSNILLMVVIEGMVRAMCTQLYLRQNPGETVDQAVKFIRKFQSMESLIMKPNWKDDIPYDFFAAISLSKHINDPQLTLTKEKLKAAESFHQEILQRSRSISAILADTTLTDSEKQERASVLTNAALENIAPWIDFEKQSVYVSIKMELQFLVRRFKDDRNEMIHGGFASYNKKWKSNIYLSAVIALYKLMKKLDQIYGETTHCIALNKF